VKTGEDLVAAVAEQEGVRLVVPDGEAYTTPWGNKARMILDKDASVSTWSNTPITSKLKTTTLKTGANGKKVGSITWTAGKTIVTVPIVLHGRIEAPSPWWRLTHPLDLFVTS
jgi:D-alanyl-D-alanine carboxypeptidase (penicillin-binding protein 5/6)